MKPAEDDGAPPLEPHVVPTQTSKWLLNVNYMEGNNKTMHYVCLTTKKKQCIMFYLSTRYKSYNMQTSLPDLI